MLVNGYVVEDLITGDTYGDFDGKSFNDIARAGALMARMSIKWGKDRYRVCGTNR